MTINELRIEIDKQRAHNIELYKAIPCAAQESPALTEWREGSKRIKQLTAELNRLLDEQMPINAIANKPTEKAERYITCTTYENAQRRMAKEIMVFMGNR